MLQKHLDIEPFQLRKRLVCVRPNFHFEKFIRISIRMKYEPGFREAKRTHPMIGGVSTGTL